MPKRKSNVKIENGKAVLSDEVLKIIESWRTEENSIWIDEYLKILNDSFGTNSKKSRGHHIIPCFVFKDETHKNRKETEPLADKIEGNIIELSIKNHIIAHNFLRLIFPNNKDAKIAFQRMSKEENIENLTEEEIVELAEFLEECANENKTKDALKYQKEWYENNKEKVSEKRKEYRKNNKEKITKYRKEWYENNKEKLAKYRKEWYENNKEKELKRQKEYDKRTYETNKEKISKRNKEWYENNKEKVSEKRKERYKNNKEKELKRNEEYRKNNKEKIAKQNKKYYEDNKTEILKRNKEKDEKRNSQQCYDPKKENYCTYGALKNRKQRNKELYKDVILINCVVGNKISN